MKKCSILSALVFVLLLGFVGMVQADLNDGLVAYYPFNGNANDESGNGNHGIENGGVNYTSGKAGQAVSLDSIDDYIDIPNVSSSSFSASLLLKVSDTDKIASQNGGNVLNGWTDGELMAISYSYIDLVSAPNENWLNYDGPGYYIMGRFHPIDLENNAKYQEKLMLYKTNLKDNSWHHIAITYDEKSLISCLFFDGVLIYSYDFTDTYTYGTPSNIYEIDYSIGYYKRGGEYFSGSIDNVRIYNRAISQSEIQELYHEGEVCEDRYDEGYEAGRQACIDDPESCGISIGSCASFDIFTNTLKIPCLDIGSIYWVDLKLEGDFLTISNFGAVEE